MTFYNLVSDQFTGLNGVTVPGTLRDNVTLLSAVLEQQIELQPTEIMSDTCACPTPAGFRAAIRDFFASLPDRNANLEALITDRFHVIQA